MTNRNVQSPGPRVSNGIDQSPGTGIPSTLNRNTSKNQNHTINRFGSSPRPAALDVPPGQPLKIFTVQNKNIPNVDAVSCFWSKG